MNDSNSISNPVARRDPWAAVSFYLALSIMVLPTEADLLCALLLSHKTQKLGEAIAVATLCFSVVFIPFYFAWRRRKREPKKWNSKGYLIATGIILSLNVLGALLTLTSQFKPHQ